MNHKLDPSSIKAIVFDFDGTLARLNIDFAVMRSSIRSLMGEYRIPEAAAGREELRSAHADLIIDKADDIINLFF